jgi:hypothetical protein
LNQHYEAEDGETTGLEVGSFPLYGLVHKLLADYDHLFAGKTYFVYLRFRRPIEKGKVVKKSVKKALDEFLKSPSEKTVEVKIIDNLSIKIIPAGTPRKGKLYLMAGYTDRDSGGWVLSELERNILICSEEKLVKVEKHRSNYSTWWLALVDHIGHGIGDDEKRHLNEGLLSGHDWDRVIIVNPINSQEAYEI